MTAFLGVSLTTTAKNNNSKATTETSVVGYISDSTCGLKHMSGMGDDKGCTLACVKGGGKFVLADRDNKILLQLSWRGARLLQPSLSIRSAHVPSYVSVLRPTAAVCLLSFCASGRDSTRHGLAIQVATPKRGSTQRIITM